MNPQWNTPPNGDFASYVERLTARAPVLSAQQRDDNAHQALDDTPESPQMQAHRAGNPATAAHQMTQPSVGRVQPMSADNLLARGLLAILTKLRQSLERNIQNTPRNR
ncbi:hypothetical protein QTI66_14625 [Variovorax sp. J22R133]|uniref:hypothetical protein n=1 Tax=Variovorax brevis TaxID=3053503 RepID=UPI0025780265|nr:hypothetical protein [Variovorax sp. J22R133]MDM0113390.1 hypothetical protein [Variovorax sp. J22R133]